MLELLLELKHNNIIELLATYAYGHVFNMIFPLAETTLFAYLREADMPRSQAERRWLFHGMYEIASALEAIHHFHLQTRELELYQIGCHHDLKPQNILVQGKKLLIADFGLARFKDIDQSSRTDWKKGTSTYGSPESGEGSTVGRSHDMWSLGCILCEVATFSVRGRQGVIAFADRRVTNVAPNKSNDYFHDGQAVKPEVFQWMDETRRYDTRDPLLRRMLELASLLLDPDPKTRLGSRELVQGFYHAERERSTSSSSSDMSSDLSSNQSQVHLQNHQHVNTTLPTRTGARKYGPRFYNARRECDTTPTSPSSSSDMSSDQPQIRLENQQLIGTSSRPLTHDGKYRTSLHHAAKDGNIVLVKSLLQVDPAQMLERVRSWESAKNLPINLAAQYGHDTIVQLLYACDPAGAIAHQELNGWNLLHLAAIDGRVRGVDTILKLTKRNPGFLEMVVQKDKYGDTPFHTAVKEGKVAVKEGKVAVKEDNIRILKLILRSMPTCNHAEKLLEKKDGHRRTAQYYMTTDTKNELRIWQQQTGYLALTSVSGSKRARISRKRT